VTDTGNLPLTESGGGESLWIAVVQEESYMKIIVQT